MGENKTKKKKTQTKKSSTSEVKNAKLVAILSYIFIIGIIWYFVDKEVQKSSLAKHHVQQGIVLVLTSLAINFVGGVIPILGWLIILPLGNLVVFVFWVFGLVYALQEKEKNIPLIGQFGKKFNI